MKNHTKNFYKLISNKFFIFLFLFIIIFTAYNSLFYSYFESDEWFYFTYYYPLSAQKFSILKAIISNFTDAGYLSGSQHVVPIASLIYLLNTKFFGLNFAPYAFMSLTLHSINSFLVYVFITTLLSKKNAFEKHKFAFLGSLFFAITPIPMHAFTGFAAFYGQNVLCVTFFLLSTIYYELSYVKEYKKLIITAIIFLFLAVFTQESATFLFMVLPLMSIFKKKVFSYKLLGLLFAACLTVYLSIRFIIPGIFILSESIINASIPSSYQTGEKVAITQINTHNKSYYENISREIIFRSVTFPIRMIGSIYLPRETVFSIASFFAPIINPSPPGGDKIKQSDFVHYTGSNMIIYITGLFILGVCINTVLKQKKNEQHTEANYVVTGISIIAFGALPLVAIIFVFPYWGYDIYFDSRYYYLPGIGAALLFPFLLLTTVKFISKTLQIKKLSFISIILLLLWLFNTISVFNKTIIVNTKNYSVDRKEIVRQITQYLPKLKEKTVFYIETDGTSPFTSLPFFTNPAQALTIVYYERSPLPDSFYNKPLFSGKSQGFQYENGRGYGYYTAKKLLADAVLTGILAPDDIYAFKYYGNNIKITNITPAVRSEFNNYYINSKHLLKWRKYTTEDNKFSFSHPPDFQLEKKVNYINISDSLHNARLYHTSVPESLDLTIQAKLNSLSTESLIIQKKVYFDRFHFNDVLLVKNNNLHTYYLKLNDVLLILQADMNADFKTIDNYEKLLGSINLLQVEN